MDRTSDTKRILFYLIAVVIAGGLAVLLSGGRSRAALRESLPAGGTGLTTTPTASASPTETSTGTPPAGTPTFISTSTQTPTSTPTPCLGSFSLVDSQNVNGANSSLWGVSAISANDAWAVGYSGPSPYAANTLTEHWDVTDWQIVASPNMTGSTSSTLVAVAAPSTNDVWAVGYTFMPSDNANRILIEHWDGTAWRIVPAPSMSQGAESLSAISVVSANDIWAVGDYEDFFGDVFTLAAHWDGTVWSIVSTPNVAGQNNNLRGVAAVSNNDVWAVGSYGNYPPMYTLAEHWDGTQWSIVDTSSSPADSVLWTVTALASDDVWAVGYTAYTGAGPLTEHWDGTQWNVVPVPGLGTGVGGSLFGVAALAHDRVLAVGYYYPDQQTSQALELEWDGKQWNLLPDNHDPAHPNYLERIAVAGSTALAVGYHHLSEDETLAEKYNGCVCTISFSDVHPTDWFYQYVSCLYCRGAITGYDDGTFRPYNFTTRGQMTKIVVIAMAIPIVTPSGTPTFNDVPRGSPFFDYVETAANLNIVSGYADGSFRPNNNVTRGKLSKITVLAANRVYGWEVLSPRDPFFSDVPRGSPFYDYIATAFCHGLISGYADGTFQPQNNATRAQISKIVCIAAENAPACDQPTPTATIPLGP